LLNQQPLLSWEEVAPLPWHLQLLRPIRHQITTSRPIKPTFHSSSSVGQIPTLGGPPIPTITIEDVPVHASGSYIIYGTSTIPLSEITTALSSASVYTLQAPTVVTDSQTLMPEVSAVTFRFGSGTTSILSVESWGSSVVLISQPQGPTSTTLDRLGDVITQSSGPRQGGSETA
jgi:hypothetical protein